MIEEGAAQKVRMAYLAIVGSHSTNGVAGIHTELLRTTTVRDFAERVLELDERSRRLAFLNRFAAEVGAGLELRGTLQVTLRAMAEALGIEQASAAIFDETRTSLVALEHYPDARATLALPPGPAGPGPHR